MFFEYDDEEGKRLAQLEQRLSGRLEHEGEADGIRLIKYIRGDLAQINKQTRAMDDKALAILRHPSRFTSNRVKFDPIINDWAADPKSIRKDLDKAEAERAATRREEAEAFRRRLDEIAAQAVARATPKADS
ncbi:hypothetical protein [Clavibacter nebraskensis]|uniref:hypothetical protein n=1 Tax=Clavibacter nebraskensis TaxID=31963 RepID=UPI003DA7195F